MFFKKKPVNYKWDMTADEAIKKYGSASNVIDEIIKDQEYSKGWDAPTKLMMEYLKEHRIEFLKLKERIDKVLK